MTGALTMVMPIGSDRCMGAAVIWTTWSLAAESARAESRGVLGIACC
jgi:hypothetical protein